MTQPDLPIDVKLMTAATHALAVLFAMLCLVALGAWAVRHPVWSVKTITVHGDVAHQNAVTFRAQLATQMKSSLSASFLTVDLQQVKRLFESVPWVRHAVVQREFPNRLRVTLQEHEAVAWWGSSGSGQLVSRLGEVFDASPDDSDGLPELAGPTELDNGARIELGRGSPDELVARTQRFTATLSQLTERYAGAVQSVDLRYPNGYALRMRGVTTVTEDTVTPTPKTR